MIYHFENLLYLIMYYYISKLCHVKIPNLQHLSVYNGYLFCLFKWENQSYLKKFHNFRDWNHLKFMIFNLNNQESLTISVNQLYLILLRRYFRHFLSWNPHSNLCPFLLPAENFAEAKNDCPQCSYSHKINTTEVSISMSLLSFFSPYK